ncbi:Acyl-coenzyme A thioesterase 12 [Ceratobasidium sp. 423]|nr:Acyl-coenzyme A thioesterase 12 [Ceratobasidium sp. 423]
MAVSVTNDLAWQNKALLMSTLTILSIVYWQGWNPSTLRQLVFSLAPKRRNTNASTEDVPPPPKPVSASSVHMSCRVTPDITDEHGRLYAGEMLKIIDVAAGVAARRHTDLNCVTISLDRVILVREIKSGDLIHVDACINRAWGSSLEAGVRVLLEDMDTGELIYCCHAYLTFVALAPAPASHPGPPPTLRLGSSTSKPNQPRKKAVIAPIVPHTLIEKKRYLFAGRRRVMRTSRPPEDLTGLRKVVSEMIPTHAKRQWASESGSTQSSAPGSGRVSPRAEQDRQQARELRSLELELLADALEAQDPHVHVDEGDVVRADVGVYGPDAPAATRADLELILEKRKRGRRPTWVGLRPESMPVVPTQEPAALPKALASPNTLTLSPSDVFRTRKLSRAMSDYHVTGGLEFESESGFDLPHMMHVEDTLACTIQIVMPQHANSVGVLFGGQLMEWMERTAVLAAHRLKRDCAWVTAGLTFRAVVTRVWTSSIEVYVCSHADVRRPYPPTPERINSPSPSSRFTNEAFLTLVALIPTPGPHTSGSPSRGNWTHLHDGQLTPVLEDAEPVKSAEDRRQHRRSMMVPTSANPVKIGASVMVPMMDEAAADIVRGADKRRAERLEMREMLLR